MSGRFNTGIGRGIAPLGVEDAISIIVGWSASEVEVFRAVSNVGDTSSRGDVFQNTMTATHNTPAIMRYPMIFF